MVQTISPSEAWTMAIAIQQASQQFVTQDLRALAEQHINGQVSIDEVERAVATSLEADRVAARIVRLLTEDSFTFTPAVLATIHRRLFMGVHAYAGNYRDYDISETIYWHFSTEQAFSYHAVPAEEAIQHLATIVGDLFEAKPFREGNRRTMTVFLIIYLRHLEFELHTDAFRMPVGMPFGEEYVKVLLRALLLGEKPMNAAELMEERRQRRAAAKRHPRNPVGKTGRAVIEALQVNPGASASLIATQFGKSTRAIEAQLSKLTALNLIRHVGSNKGGYWEVLQA